MHSISREAQDDFSFRSHELAAAATTDGHFKKEIVKWLNQKQSKF